MAVPDYHDGISTNLTEYLEATRSKFSSIITPAFSKKDLASITTLVPKTEASQLSGPDTANGTATENQPETIKETDKKKNDAEIAKNPNHKLLADTTPNENKSDFISRWTSPTSWSEWWKTPPKNNQIAKNPTPTPANELPIATKIEPITGSLNTDSSKTQTWFSFNPSAWKLPATLSRKTTLPDKASGESLPLDELNKNQSNEPTTSSRWGWWLRKTQQSKKLHEDTTPSATNTLSQRSWKIFYATKLFIIAPSSWIAWLKASGKPVPKSMQHGEDLFADEQVNKLLVENSPEENNPTSTTANNLIQVGYLDLFGITASDLPPADSSDIFAEKQPTSYWNAIFNRVETTNIAKGIHKGMINKLEEEKKQLTPLQYAYRFNIHDHIMAIEDHLSNEYKSARETADKAFTDELYGMYDYKTATAMIESRLQELAEQSDYNFTNTLNEFIYEILDGNFTGVWQHLLTDLGSRLSDERKSEAIGLATVNYADPKKTNKDKIKYLDIIKLLLTHGFCPDPETRNYFHDKMIPVGEYLNTPTMKHPDISTVKEPAPEINEAETYIGDDLGDIAFDSTKQNDNSKIENTPIVTGDNNYSQAETSDNLEREGLEL